MRAELIDHARGSIYGNARRIDRAAYEVVFEGSSATRLVEALHAYTNPDGGFGHALEPDLRTPASQPLHTETALMILQQCGHRQPVLADRCCEFLSTAAGPNGALPAFLPGALEYPAAAHWQAGFGAVPTLDRTLGMAALLHWHGARHPWSQHAVRECRGYLPNATITDAHHLLYAMQFASTILGGTEGARTLARLRDSLEQAEFYVAEPPIERYGLTPLHYAPGPDHPAAALFDPELLERHLGDLIASQMPDGSWPVRFQPPSEGALIEWRGRWTVEALLVLRSYGRI